MSESRFRSNCPVNGHCVRGCLKTEPCCAEVPAAADIDAEKASKPRPDLVPPAFMQAAGRALASGLGKHGGGQSGWGTYRDAGTEQALVTTHVASFQRHWEAFRQGLRDGDPLVRDPGTGLPEIDCACAQLSIIADLLVHPPEAKTAVESEAKTAVESVDGCALPDGLWWEHYGTARDGWWIQSDDLDSAMWLCNGEAHPASRLLKHPDADQLVALLKRRNGR